MLRLYFIVKTLFLESFFWRKITFVQLFALASMVNAPFAMSNADAELEGVVGEINHQQQLLSMREKQFNDLQSDLKSQELEIIQLEQDMTKTKTQLRDTFDYILQLEKQIKKEEQTQKLQEKQLEKLLQIYYVTKHSKTQYDLFLNNNDQGERISYYFQHIAKVRANLIDELANTTHNLKQNKKQLEAKKEQIKQILDEQLLLQQEFISIQSKRKKTLLDIQQKINVDKKYLAELQRNENRLKAEIAKAVKQNFAQMNGLAKERGRLPWPVDGQVLRSFGSPQTSQINWKGIVIAAKYDQQIQAIYSGKVVFAEYLRGYGLLILLDHGKGDMTLYGFNKALLKNEGDLVNQGDVIALAGDTGGQARPSLYFEIRRNSEAKDPIAWLKKK